MLQNSCKMFNVRKMEEKDEDVVIALLNQSFPHVGMTREKLKRRIKNGARFFVAESCEGVIGFVEMRIGRYASYLRGISVKEEWRKKGVGTALLKRAIAEAKTSGVKCVWLKVRAANIDAIRVYSRFGFFIRKEQEHRKFGRIYIMKKKLET